MENDILDSLSDLGYEGPLSNEEAFAKALEGGPKSLEYTKLVHILAEELKVLCKLEENVSIMNDSDESSSFLLELSSFLKELGCPYKKLVTGHMSSRLQTKEDRILLLDYLVSELMAARMVRVDCVKENTGMQIVMQESQTAKDLKDILITLKFNKPPPNITPDMLFAKLEAKLKDCIAKEGDLVGKPLYNKALTDKEWKDLDEFYNEMFEDYRLRRETLITRLECTIQSFEWSDRLKSKTDIIQSTYRPKREQLKLKPSVKLSDFLAARTDLLYMEKTSSASVRKNTISEVNKVLIGRVPDRGGRPNEAQPPPPEMPSWQQRSTQAARGGRGGGQDNRGGRGGGQDNRGGRGGGQDNRGGRGGGQDRGGRGGQGGYRGKGEGRGGRVQGGYNQNSGDVRQSGYQKGYDQNIGYDNRYNQNNQGGGGYQNQGYQNNQSYQNSYGYQNNHGYQGNQNNQGYQGNQNNHGYQGNQNNQGYQGNQNNHGYQGNHGYQSNQGYSGYKNEHDDRRRGGFRGRR